MARTIEHPIIGGHEMLGGGFRFFDRRKHTRHLLSKDAKILLRNNSFQLPCSIIEIAKSGARLRPADGALLPNEFRLLVSSGEKIWCEVIHRSGDEIGVRFLS